jgi:hypothetical protein
LILGVIGFVVTLLIPAVEIARFTGKHTNLRATMTPAESEHLRRMQRDWEQWAGLPRALGVGLSTTLVAVSAGCVTRALRRRDARGL